MPTGGHNLGQTNNNFFNLPPYGVGQPGSILVGGGGGVPEPYFRNTADAVRSMYRRTPEAAYPDGYLGTITSRRSDRVLDALKSRINQRNYQRGVHKGERIDPGDYFWPEEMDPNSGLVRDQFSVVSGFEDNEGHVYWVQKNAPLGTDVVVPTSEEILPATGARLTYTLNPKRQEQLRHLAPVWRW